MPDGLPELVSVILCALNASATIGAQLDALVRQDYAGRWELVVVDDGSTDSTVDIVRSYDDRLPVSVVATPNPAGLVRARNVGSEAAKGDLLVYCDADDVADPGWLSAIVRAADGAGAVGGQLEEEALNSPEVRAWRPKLTDGALPMAFGIERVPVGANCAVWRDVYESVGRWDETLNFTGEEVDFFLRVSLAGHRIAYAPDAVMHYRLRDTMRGVRRQAYLYGRGNVALFERFRHVGLSRTSARETARYAWLLVRGAPGAMRSRAKRGAWMRFAWYLGGQTRESVRMHTWHLG